jgi:hypothetical protein
MIIPSLFEAIGDLLKIAFSLTVAAVLILLPFFAVASVEYLVDEYVVPSVSETENSLPPTYEL